MNHPGNSSKRAEFMPILFVGHGNPMNAMENNAFSKNWQTIGKILPRPKAILCISAHWETRGTQLTNMEKPRTIHDFGGFPKALYEVQYPAPGSPWLASTTKELIQGSPVLLDSNWGFDHGCWSVLKQMFPAADIPVMQMSLDQSKRAADHYALAKEIALLREMGVLIVGSGNMVHNLRLVEMKGDTLDDFNQPFGFDWAIEANDLFKRLIDEHRHAEMADYHSLGMAVRLAVPTPEHYLPMLYILALQKEEESVIYFNDLPVGGSLTMTSFIIDSQTRNNQYAKKLAEPQA
jgi:4,5-DOPA dioxygenase extradiol